MKEKKPYETEPSDQPAESEQQTPASKNGVFLKRGKGQSFEEFKKVCIQRFIDAGLIKEGTRQPKASSGYPSNEQNLPNEKDQQ